MTGLGCARASRPVLHPAAWLCVCIVWLAAPWALAQPKAADAGAPSAEAAGKPVVQPIAIAKIGVRAEQAKQELAELEKQLEPSEATRKVGQGLPELQARIQAQLAEVDAALTAEPSLGQIDSLKLRWDALRAEVKRQQGVLTTASSGVEARIEQMRAIRDTWRATRDAAVASDAPPQIIQQIADVEASIARAIEQGRDRLGEIAASQSRVAQLAQVIDSDVSRLTGLRENLIERAFRADSPPLWSPQAFELLDRREIFRRIRDSQREDYATIRQFGRDHARGIALHGVLLVAMTFSMFSARKRVRRRTDDEGLVAVRVIFEHPIALSLLLIVLISIWALPQPRPVAQLVGIGALFPAILILRSILDRPVFPLLNALVVFWVVERLRALLAPLPMTPRLIFVAEMLAIIALLAWWSRPARLIDVPSEIARSAFFRVLALGVRIMLLSALLALCAETSGYSTLGRLIGGGALFGAYAAVILYGAIRVLDGLVAFLLRVRPLRLLGVVRNHRWLVRSRMMQLFKFAAVLWWLSATLRRLEIFDEVWGAVVAVVSAELFLGEAHIAVGDVLAFVVVVWASFKLSRFTRFLLEEDVYTRVPLRKGMPYALSTLAHYAILLTGFFVAIVALGLDMNRFALLAGAFGVGIGFGLQSIVNNFVSGLVLLTERPIEVGDSIEVAGTLGVVERIGIRSSTLRTWQGAELIVPNAELVAQQVTNWTHSDRKRRIEIPVGVAYGSDPKRVIEVLLEVATGHAEILDEPAPSVLFTGFGDSSLDFEARVWTGEFDRYLIVRSALCVGFEAALRAAGIVIPFPQRDLHLKSTPQLQAAGAPADRGEQTAPDSTAEGGGSA